MVLPPVRARISQGLAGPPAAEWETASMRITVLAGGVGAARFLRGYLADMVNRAPGNWKTMFQALIAA